MEVVMMFYEITYNYALCHTAGLDLHESMHTLQIVDLPESINSPPPLLLPFPPLTYSASNLLSCLFLDWTHIPQFHFLPLLCLLALVSPTWAAHLFFWLLLLFLHLSPYRQQPLYELYSSSFPTFPSLSSPLSSSSSGGFYSPQE